ncbi:MAG: hypothetical protein ACFE8L_04245 [Candidatus Hodarchaeota archaeon]
MTEEELRIKISDKEDDITRIEEDAAKKEAGAEKEIEADWDADINETKSKLEIAKTDLKEAKEKASEWVSKRDKLDKEVNSLSIKFKDLKKGKTKALNKKLSDIENEKKTKIKKIEKEISAIKKQLDKLEAEKLKQQEG